VQVATEAKPFASLSSGLLARKGAARPAMRPQGFGQGASGLEDLGWNDMGFEPPKAAEAPRDLSHDAFGEDVVQHPRSHPTGLTPIDSPVHSPVHHQQAEIVERLNGIDETEEDEVDETAEIFEPSSERIEQAAVEQPAPLKVVSVAQPVTRRAPRQRAAVGSKGKAAFTLRLDPERHLKLRLACAVDGRSAQQLVTDALDQLLERMPDLDGLAAKAKNRG
jgi:ribosomal protein L44E